MISAAASVNKLPDGQAVERVAITLAAAVGLTWGLVPAEDAQRFRVMANAVLMRALPEALATPAAPLALEEAVQAMRSAARGLEGIDEGLIQRLYRAAAKLEILNSVVTTEVDLGPDAELV